MTTPNQPSKDAHIGEWAGLLKTSWHMMQVEVRAIAHAHGWITKQKEFGTLIALIHSELSEALEAMRHGNPSSEHIPEFTGVEEELADVIIRIMDLAEAWNFRVVEAVLAKIEFNRTRPYRHGNKKF